MKFSKNLFSLAVSFAMILTLFTPNFVAAADKPELKVTLDKSSAYAGNEFNATVSLNTNSVTNITGLQIRLKYDPNVLEPIGEEPTKTMPTPEGYLCQFANSTITQSSNFMMTGDGSVPITYNGDVFTAKFKVKEGAAVGKTSLTFDVSDEFYPIQDSINNQKIESTIINADLDVLDYTMSLNKTSEELNVDDTDKLTVTFDPAELGQDKTISWESSDTSVVIVNNGQVTAKGPGNATVTASVSDTKYVTCTYKVKAPLKSILIENGKDSIEMLKNQTKTLNITYDHPQTTDSKEVTWESSNSDVVTVDEKGQIKAIKEGTATITATSKVSDSIKDTIDVTVKEIPLTGISINEVFDKMDKGEKVQLTVAYNPENTTDDKTVTWASSDPTVATVNENGEVTALKEGEVKITATSGNLDPAELVFKVEEYHLTSIDLSQNKGQLVVGDNYNVLVGLNPENCTDELTFEWGSSDESIILLSEDGTYTALKEGKATIVVKVTTEYGKEISNSFDVEVLTKDEAANIVDQNEDSNNSDVSSPQTGDLPIVGIVVVAAVALIGSIVIAKKKLIRQK